MRIIKQIEIHCSFIFVSVYFHYHYSRLWLWKDGQVFKNQVTVRHMIVNLMCCSHLKIAPNAHQGKEATEHLSEHKRRLHMDSEVVWGECLSCESYKDFIRLHTNLLLDLRLGCNMKTLEVYYTNLLFVVSLKENAVFHKNV